METRAAKRRRLLYGHLWPSVDQEASAGSSSSSRTPARETAAQRAQNKRTAAAAAAAAAAAMSEPKFHLFGRLPAELRIEIWRLVEEQARQPLHPLRVRLYRGYVRVAAEDDTARTTTMSSTAKQRKRRYTNRLVPRLTAMPDLGPATRARRALLRVCREARYEYLRRWSATLDLDRGGLVRFDAARDLIYLDIANRALMDDLALLHATNPAALPPFVHAIRHLGLEMTPHLPQWLLMARDHMMPRLDFLLSFPALQSLSLVNFGCFAGEVTWSLADEARLLLARSAGHRVYFRSFAVLPGFDYSDRHRSAPRVGRQTSLGAHTRHDCAICSIHRCVYVREMLRRPSETAAAAAAASALTAGGGVVAPSASAAASAFALPSTTTDAERRWLSGLKFHTLLAASTPEVERHVQRLDPASLAAGSDKPVVMRGGGGGSGHGHHGDPDGLDDPDDEDNDEDNDDDDDDADDDGHLYGDSDDPDDEDLFWEAGDGEDEPGLDQLVAIMEPYGGQFF